LEENKVIRLRKWDGMGLLLRLEAGTKVLDFYKGVFLKEHNLSWFDKP
jgi:hypothetical protein